ncbi:MFS transporter [Nesterenkonia sp. E16_7]|uniref:MFS transporter n=1 Tax=unclassified Nesterenkonia TaxID=2629769 RepID=UPI001A92ABAB|nr:MULTISPECIES: MFS transporter [unclassified Nesterenkonia]MBO0596111.1 MFS transporter [Nesterenkonia sp. E16_10]MBO0599286.1 MFS transporter [Nesterenkonia sp. E16_7]
MTRDTKIGIPAELKVMIVSAFVIAIGFGIVAPILPQYASDFGVSAMAVSAVVSAFGLFRLIFAPASGKLTQWLGETPVYVIGLLIVAVSMIATAYAPSYELLLLFRALGGIGSTFFTVSAMTFLARKSPPTIRGRVSGAYASAFLIGSVAGPLVGSGLLVFGPRVPFLVYGAALVVAAAIVFVMLRQSRLEDRGRKEERETATLAEAWQHRGYRAALTAGFANGWATFGLRNSVVPLFAATAFVGSGWVLDSSQLAGVALATFAAGNVAAVLLFSRRSDRLGRRRPIILGLLVSALATGLLGLAPSPLVLLLLSVIAGAGTGLMNPAQQAAIADIVGSGRNGGSVVSTFQMTQDLGAIIGPLLAGFLVDQLGYAWAFGVTGVILMFGALAWTQAPETLEAETESADATRP